MIYIDYLEMGKPVNSDYYIELLVRLKGKVTKKRPYVKKKKFIFHQDEARCHKSMKTKAKLNELGFSQLPHPQTLQIWPTTGSLLISERCSRKKKMWLNEEVIAATEANFEAKDKSFYKHGIEKLESIGLVLSHLKVIRLMNKNEFCGTNVVFFVSPDKTYRTM